MGNNEQDEISSLMKRHQTALSVEPSAKFRTELFTRASRRPGVSQMKQYLAWAAAGVVAVLSFQMGRNISQPQVKELVVQEVVAGHVRSMMANHLADVDSTDRHTVKPWFEGKLDFGPDVQNFVERDFPLIGGRLDYIANRPVAALVYRHGQHVINLYEWPSAEVDHSAPRLIVQRGFQIFTWHQDGLEYWTISDLNAADLKSFAALLAHDEN